MIRAHRFALLLLMIPLGTRAQEVTPREWPRIAAFKKTFVFPDMANPSVDLAISGVDGGPLYKLECRSADTYEGNEFDYSGDFECRLNSASGKDGVRTLLTYDPVPARDSESRARFLYSDVEGKCGDYPQYGRNRTFRLRGMRLRLSLAYIGHGSILPSNPGRAASAAMRFVVEARPDPTALSQIAEDVPYVDPAIAEPGPGTRTCLRVTPKHVPGTGERELAQQGLGPPFPVVAALENTFEIAPRARTVKPKHVNVEVEPAGDLEPEQLLSLALTTPQGEPTYDVECYRYGPGIGRWGMRCGLYPEGKDFNLLAESVDVYTRKSRAEFFAWQLYGNCATYPEWGAERHFRLRGMEITIALSEIGFAPRGKQPTMKEGALERARVRVRVEPDAAASAPVALPSRILDWENAAGPGTCQQVLVNPNVPKQAVAH